MDQATARWRQSGTVYVWQYVDDSRNYRGRHLTADADGCASLVQLIDLMHAAEFTAQAVVQLASVGTSQLQVPGYFSRAKSFQHWQIVHSKQKFVPNHWLLTEGETEQHLCLEIGVERLTELRKGVEGIRSGNGDYRIGEDGEALWFWWMPPT